MSSDLVAAHVKTAEIPTLAALTSSTITRAQLTICEHAPDDAALILDMLGIGER